MNQLQSSLFDTMKQFSNYTKNTSTFPVTIECAIESVKDAGAGIYTVDYLGSDIDCYSTNGMSYLVGDKVYILVPDGDFSKNKIILGLIDTREKQNFSKVEDNIYNYRVSDNLFKNKTASWTNPIELCSYVTTNNNYILFNTGTARTFFYNTLKSCFTEDHNTFALSYYAKTELAKEQQNSGNYGITLSIPLKIKTSGNSADDITIWKDYVLDISNMTGNPYNFKTWAPQTTYFSIDSEQYTFDMNQSPILKVYCYGFSQDSTKNNIKDIFIKDIDFYAVDPLEITEEGDLGIVLKVSEGLYFSDNYSDTKTITAILRYKGEEINLKNSTAEIYWFRENIYVTDSNDPRYCQFGGRGWECLNEETTTVTNNDGTTSSKWITNIPTIDVERNTFYTSIRYKCTIIYNSNKISKEVKLVDPQSDASFELYSTAKDNIYIKDMGEAHVVARVWVHGITDINSLNDSSDNYRNNIIYTWARYDRNNNFINSGQFYKIVRNNEIIFINGVGYYETEITFPVAYIEEANYIRCTAVLSSADNINNPKIIGTEVIKLETRQDPAEYTVIINGDDLIYKYDVNGISPVDSDKYHGPMTSRVNYIEPLSYTILKRDGTELTKEEYAYVYYKWAVPKDTVGLFREVSVPGSIPSADDEYYYFEGYDSINHNVLLQYKIKSIYNKSAALKKIGLTITIPTKKIEIEQIVNISFMKEGENGTNGSEYAVEIVGGSLNLDEQAPIGTFDRVGNPIQLKYLYSVGGTGGAFNRLWVHSVNNGGVNWRWVISESSLINNNDSKLYLKVYKNGNLITYDPNTDNPPYTVTWSMYDSDHCLKFYDDSYKTRPDYTVLTLDTSKSINIDSKYANILQVKVHINEVNERTVSVGAGRDIYAYYPIDFIITSQQPGQFKPDMMGGFFEVMYESNGMNPKYNIINKLFSLDMSALRKFAADYGGELGKNVDEYYSITWENKYHLSPWQYTGPTCEVVPDYKYDDGETNNYVSATLAFKQDKETSIRNEINNLETRNGVLNAEISKINTNLTILQNAGSSVNKNEFDEYLQDIRTLLDVETRTIDELQILQDYVNQLENYMSIKESTGIVDYNRTEVWRYLKNQIRIITIPITRNIQVLRQLDGVTFNYNSLESLEPYTFEFDKARYCNELDINTVYQLENYIKQINRQIDRYQKYYKDIKVDHHYDDELLDKYNDLIQDINNLATILQNANLYERYRKVGDKVASFRLQFNKYVSANDLERLINELFHFIIQPIITEEEISGTEYNRIQPQVYNELVNLRNEDTTEIAMNLDRIAYYQNAILNAKNVTVVYIRPIVVYFNRYEQGWLNEWDGNKLKMSDDEDGDYLIAPRVGAGKKESDNSFTGVTMGQYVKRDNGVVQYRRCGLFGHAKGKQSFFLNAENGSAVFGISGYGGQIVIDPSKENNRRALLYSSNFWKPSIIEAATDLPRSYPPDSFINHIGKDNDTWCAKAGMLIDLSTPEIVFGSGLFSVDSGGHLHAEEVDVSGTIKARDGEIGGWIIGTDEIYSKTNDTSTGTKARIHLKSYVNSEDPTNFKTCIYSGDHDVLIPDVAKEGFYLGPDGLSIGSNFVVNAGTGAATIEADSSTIGQWKIRTVDGKKQITSTSNSQGIFLNAADSAISLGNDSTGKIYSGEHTTLNSSLKGFYLSNDGLSIHNSLRITTDNNIGTLEIGKLDGSHWTVRGESAGSSSRSYISYYTTNFHEGGASGGVDNSVYLGTDGISLGKYFSVDNNGNLKATNVDLTGKITATSGKISGFTIDGYDLYSGTRDITGPYFGLHINGVNGFELECGKLVQRFFPGATTEVISMPLVCIGHLGEIYAQTLAVKQRFTIEEVVVPEEIEYIQIDETPIPENATQHEIDQIVANHPELSDPASNNLYRRREGEHGTPTLCTEHTVERKVYYYNQNIIPEHIEYEKKFHPEDSEGNAGDIIADGEILTYSGLTVGSNVSVSGGTKVTIKNGNIVSDKGTLTLIKGDVEANGIIDAIGQEIGGKITSTFDVIAGRNLIAGQHIYANNGSIYCGGDSKAYNALFVGYDINGNPGAGLGNGYICNDLYVGYTITTPQTGCGTGNIYCNGTVIPSDKRNKKDIKSLNNKSEDFIYSLNPVEFKYKNPYDEKVHHGFIAQEVQELIDEDNALVQEGFAGMLGISYTEIIADLVKVVQNQNDRIKKLEEMILKKES